MSRLAACPKCRNQFTLPVLTGPATIACPFCAAHITIKVKQAAPPPAMIVQPAVAMAQAMPEEDEYEDEPPKKKKKKKKKKSMDFDDSNPPDETWMKISILVGVVLITVIAIVGAFAWYIYSYKSSQNIIVPTEMEQKLKNGK